MPLTPGFGLIGILFGDDWGQQKGLIMGPHQHADPAVVGDA